MIFMLCSCNHQTQTVKEYEKPQTDGQKLCTQKCRTELKNCTHKHHSEYHKDSATFLSRCANIISNELSFGIIATHSERRDEGIKACALEFDHCFEQCGCEIKRVITHASR